MLDINTPNGYKAVTDGQSIAINDLMGRVMLIYQPGQAEVIWGKRTKREVTYLREDLEYVRELLAGTPVE